MASSVTAVGKKVELGYVIADAKSVAAYQVKKPDVRDANTWRGWTATPGPKESISFRPDTHERTYLDLRIIVTAIAQLSLKGQAGNRAQDSYSRLCFWKARDHDLSIAVPRIQVLSLVLLFEQGRGLSDFSTRDALHRACQVMLKNKFSSSLTVDEWHNPGLFDVWIVLSGAILLLKYGLNSYITTYLIQRSETDKEVAILERYFDLPYPPAGQLERRFGDIGTATQYTQRVQSMHERYLPL
ncbi:hypothetical protein ARSEF1564_005223 [Beauveria bassiana]